ncbi:MAG TPA: vWA domain-containing protein [Isosphaeraceae bacterium]|jgi:Mg-chelatase subunit ChlD|nr:vWA domain-containing protein [Isosphaeraceae bacterium]
MGSRRRWLAIVTLLFLPLTTAQADEPAKPKPKAKPATPAQPGAAAKPAKAGAKPKTKPKPPADAGPTIKAEGPSPSAVADLLRSPGDRYNATDWSRIPAWRQSSFFGIRTQGQTFIYVIDCSGSMDQDGRLDRAKAELRRSVNALQFPQRFHVIFYNDRPVPLPGNLTRSADFDAKLVLDRWLELVDAEGETDPRSALKTALSLRPDAVFLLSDGEFPDGTAAAVAKANRGRVPIHCIDLGGAGSPDLHKIAADSKGQYVARGR